MFLQRPRTGGKKDATKLLLTALLSSSSVSSRHLVGVVKVGANAASPAGATFRKFRFPIFPPIQM